MVNKDGYIASWFLCCRRIDSSVRRSSAVFRDPAWFTLWTWWCDVRLPLPAVWWLWVSRRQRVRCCVGGHEPY